ncbi:hypothetical protein DY000_02022468 [Brassica cretica]|uniref:Uncharacterized protein n=1 Tax=Brassica cretica TaxID=69181 RepID=A0ABQ7EDE4_BRACR|nr:hypothetical protein DY000_02022468 [Brassica cretica]
MKQPKLISNTKPAIAACLGAWYTWDRILQTSLEGQKEVNRAWWQQPLSFDSWKPVQSCSRYLSEILASYDRYYKGNLSDIKERLDKRCDDIYFPFNNTISGLDSHAEWLQKEVKAIQRQLAAQHQISASIDRKRAQSLDGKSPRSTDKHIITSIDAESTPAGEQLIHKNDRVNAQGTDRNFSIRL